MSCSYLNLEAEAQGTRSGNTALRVKDTQSEGFSDWVLVILHSGLLWAGGGSDERQWKAGDPEGVRDLTDSSGYRNLLSY